MSNFLFKTLPRTEHPKPQFQRDQWLNLNGTWNFAFDFELSGREKGMSSSSEAKEWHKDPSGLEKEIIVPFCPESELSGIGYTDFIPAVWYHRNIEIPEDWAGKRILLHFGAVDYDCRVWVNGQFVGRHLGGSSSFYFDITPALQDGENQLVVYASDDTRSGKQPCGKQSKQLKSHGCVYTRTTGIWQTVWLEAVSESRIESVQVVPDLDNSCFIVTPTIKNVARGMTFKAVLLDGDEVVASSQIAASSGTSTILAINEPHLWSIDDPHLYDLRLELLEGEQVVDSVKSYAGLRKFHIEDNKFFLNNEPIFLRFVLDQGFYPDGIWTAPSDVELKKDIERSKAVGFNGARLHQKVFEERFHYWADRLGYLTWGEFCDWGMNFGKLEAIHNQQREWREIVVRDRNHPSIVAWTPFNETAGHARAHGEIHTQALQEVYELTRSLDPTRPINDASGYVHVHTDIFTVHDYNQNPETFRERYDKVEPQNPEEAFVCHSELSVPYEGQPYVVDEYGGTFWTTAHIDQEERGSGRAQWGYGKTADQVEDLIEELSHILLQNPNIAGFTYTQLTDIEQEVNGVYTYARELKFDAERLRKAFGAPAAIEKLL